MGDQPIADVIGRLAALRGQVHHEFDRVAADAGHQVHRTIRAVDARAPSAGPGRPTARLTDLARLLAADLAYAGAQADDAIDAELRRLRQLLAESTPTGRRPPENRPSPVAGGPAPRVGPVPAPAPVPGLAEEPALTDGAEYAAVAFTAPARLGVDSPSQGRISDCHVIAALCTLADRAPALLTRSVHVEDDVVVVDVPGRRYRLRPTLPVDVRTGELTYANCADGSTLVPYLEKAYAVYGGGYPVLGRGGFPAEALFWLTGQPSYMLRLGRADDDMLTALLCSGHPAVACSWRLDDDPLTGPLAGRYGVLRAGHAYAVTGLDDGRVVLHNPWGMRHPQPVPLDVFRMLFSRVDWCELDED